jgi:hypothetical protein
MPRRPAHVAVCAVEHYDMHRYLNCIAIHPAITANRSQIRRCGRKEAFVHIVKCLFFSLRATYINHSAVVKTSTSPPFCSFTKQPVSQFSYHVFHITSIKITSNTWSSIKDAHTKARVSSLVRQLLNDDRVYKGLQQTPMRDS